MDKEQNQRLKSYTVRSGRLRQSHKDLLKIKQQLPEVITYDSTLVLDAPSLFKEVDAIVVEIGFGMGDSLLTMAQHYPNIGFIGIEVFPHGFASCLLKLRQLQLDNLKLIQADAVEVIEHMLKDHTIDQFHIYQPDPWPKKRHHKRRLLQTSFFQLLMSKLKNLGRIHICTDHSGYADYIQSEIDTLDDQWFDCQRLEKRAGFRPKTKYEERGIRLGHKHHEFLLTSKLKLGSAFTSLIGSILI